MTHEWPHAPVSVKRLASLYFSLAVEVKSAGPAGAASSAPPPGVGAAAERLLVELESFSFALARADSQYQRCKAEAAAFAALQEDITHRTAATEQELTALRALLEAEQLAKVRRAEYERLAKEISLLPSRTSLTDAIARVTEEVEVARREQEGLERTLANRQAQFGVLDAAIGALRSEWAEAERERTGGARAAAEKGGAAPAAAAGVVGQSVEEEEGGREAAAEAPVEVEEAEPAGEGSPAVDEEEEGLVRPAVAVAAPSEDVEIDGV